MGKGKAEERALKEMATTDLDGVNLMLLREGTQVTLVLGDKSYMGTLRMRKEGVQESWYIALDEPGAGEIEIHKREGAVGITDKPRCVHCGGTKDSPMPLSSEGARCFDKWHREAE